MVRPNGLICQQFEVRVMDGPVSNVYDSNEAPSAHACAMRTAVASGMDMLVIDTETCHTVMYLGGSGDAQVLS